MIEKKVVADKFTEYAVSRFIDQTLGDVPIDKVTFEQTPSGERITIYTSAPGLVIGREGSNIRKLTDELIEKFSFKNPQVKIGDVVNENLSARIVAKSIANNLSRFGSQKFKLTGFKALQNVMNSGAMGVEIRLTGKLPSARAKSWSFNKGYLKKTGYISDFVVDKAVEHVTLKSGVVGIKVQIMLPETPLPDKINYLESVLPQETLEKVVIEKKVVEDEVFEEWNY